MLKTIFLTAVVVSSIFSPAYAETDLTSEQQTEMVVAHNNWRSKVKVPALHWSNTLADSAQAYANTLKDTNDCQMVHSHTKGLGENLFWASPLSYSDGRSEVQAVGSAKVVDDWASERLDYHYRSNSCSRGKVCGHYTQVVWKNTAEVGCGKAVCGDNSQIWVCQYTPAGNYVGQRPY